jgi:TRAP-type C4-dicarboxylate transport system substrate-binding protein
VLFEIIVVIFKSSHKEVGVMKKGCLLSIVVLLLSFGIASAAEPDVLKFAIMDPAQAAPVVNAYKPWAEKVSDSSAGTLKIDLFPGGSLGRNPKVLVKLVTDGVADLAFVIPSYTQGKFPEDEVFNMPFVADNGLESGLASQSMYEKGMLSGYDDLKVIAHFTTDVFYLHTDFPVHVPADLKGHKIRAATKFQADLLKRLGAVGIAVPVSKTAENISRGVIEGSINDNSSLMTFRIKDVAKHHLMLPMGGVSLAVVMNKDKYESLQPQAKQALDQHGVELIQMWYEAVQGDVSVEFDKLKKDPKHSVYVPTEADMQLWVEAFQPSIDSWLKEDSRRPAALENYKHELTLIRAKQ